MNRLVRTTCAALFAGTTTCSLILSASSTMAKATTVHIPPAIVWSAVGVLELVSLAGTLRWLTATTARGRAHAIVVVVLAALVTAQAGWSAYGWWGAIAPVAVVVTIHMVAETLGDSDQAPVLHVVETTTPVEPPVETTEPAVEPEPWRDHCPTEAEYAATILDHLPRDGQRLTQQEMLEALRVVSPDCSLYRVKQYRRSPLEVAS